jgi:hypothetical protein
VTYVDDGGVRYYRHRPEPVRSFEACVNIRDRCDGLLLSTPDGVHEMEIELRAYQQGQMQPVLRVRGQATPDGRLQVVVTNTLTETVRVIEIETDDDGRSGPAV